MSDSVYYRRRLAEELAAARGADCAKAAAAHRELAEIYRLLIWPEEKGATLVVLTPETMWRR